MARSTDQVLAQFERFVPPGLKPLRAVLAGWAAMMAAAEAAGDTLVTRVTLGGADGIWATLLARGYGIERADGEADASLIGRVRTPELALTKARLIEAANNILAPYTSESVILVEHWAAGEYYDDDAYFDQAIYFDQHNAFTLVVPQIGDLPYGDDFYDDDDYFDDDAFYGDGGGDPAVYAAILSEIDRLRASGVRWYLLVDPDYPFPATVP